MFSRIHLYNNYLIHVIYFVLCSAVEPMTTLSWQLCKQACYQVGYGTRSSDHNSYTAVPPPSTAPHFGRYSKAMHMTMKK